MDIKKLYLALVIAFIATFGTVFIQHAGVMPFLIVCGSMIAAIPCRLATTYKVPADPKKVLPIYLLIAAMLMAHVWEEYLFEFGPRIGVLTGTGFTQGQFLVEIAFFLPVFWILGAVGLYFRHPLGNYVLWFVILGMILGEPVHLLVFPFLEGGRYHYFPGMWTALFPLVPGLWAFHVLVQGYRENRAREAQ